MTDREDKLLWFILAYLGIFAIIPLLMEQDDEDVQWHSKHGLVLFAAEMIIMIGVIIFTTILHFILPSVMWIFSCMIWAFLWLGLISLHIVCIMKAVRGERLMIPVLSSLADKF